jgi:hypothetical protein
MARPMAWNEIGRPIHFIRRIVSRIKIIILFKTKPYACYLVMLIKCNPLSIDPEALFWTRKKVLQQYNIKTICGFFEKKACKSHKS